MNTALVDPGRVPAGPINPVGPISLIGRMSRRIGMLIASAADARRRRPAPSREELIELHERRQVAQRLREEQFQRVVVGRLL
ncbi:hypothetical protein [Agromyces sp. Leaf222]|uniref:hypothetical protein n=1 Tax=Agromyces sp. Leaf222 TaxID=1735688 RepID=UPI0006F77C87|nr:hypothetical protein [Agromyces sp. Leaf222]KQM82302.1 hypothetical protein ASE68_02545 [Agromyces sp. Leaf222]